MSNEDEDEDKKTTVDLVLPARFRGRAVRATEDLEPSSGSSASSADVSPASAILVKIERVERADGPMLAVPYADGSESTQHYYFPADKNEFEVPAIVADAAVGWGFFRAVK